MYRARGVVVAEKQGNAISFGGIPNSRNFFLFTNLSEACCEAKRWNHLRNPVEPDLAAPKPPPKPSPERC